MKYYLLVLAIVSALLSAGVVPATALAADAVAANSIVEKMNINQASAVDLQQLPGIGPALSERIVTYRKERGPFKSIEQLTEVKGVGEAKLAKFRARLSID